MVRLYPNPTTGVLKINNEEKVQIAIYDVLGKQLVRNSLDSGLNQVDLSLFTSGVYFVKVQLLNNPVGGVKTYRIIKQ